MAMISGHHCNGGWPRWSVLRDPISRDVLFLAEPSRSTVGHWCTGFDTLEFYVPAISLRLHYAGGTFKGKMCRRTTAITSPQRRQSNWGPP